MKQKHLWPLVYALFFVLSGSGNVRAEEPKSISYELYSWKHGPGWYFSVLEGTTTVRDRSTIEARKTLLKGTSYLKGRLANLRPGDQVYWRENKSQGLPLPSHEMIREVRTFSEGVGLTLVLPEEAAKNSR